MSKIVYYPDCKDIFDIGQIDGISYYLIDKKNTYNKQEIKNICSMQKYFSSDWVIRSIVHRETLHNNGQKIVEKIGNYTPFTFRRIDCDDRYRVWNNTQMASGSRNGMTSCLLTTEGNSQFIGVSVIQDKEKEMAPTSSTARIIYTSNKKEEAESFLSWINLKFTRYFLAINIGKLSATMCDDFFRLVPDPGAFDHIFTDEELYAKYGLAQDEINIIESVIKERK